MITYIVLAVLIGVVIRTMSTARPSGGASDKEVAELRERMLRLEQSVETMTADVERMSEGQRFLTALLEERSKGQPAIKPPPPVPPAT
jgi:hypothetical protein